MKNEVLGQEGNKVKYFLAITGSERITGARYSKIEKAFTKAAEERDSAIEEVRLHDFYISLLILCSTDYAIGDIIDAGLAGCKFLNTDYYLTNTEVPTDERIKNWIEGNPDYEL